MRIVVTITLLILLAAFVFVTPPAPALAQHDDEATRKLWDTAFVGRPNQKPARRRSKARYRNATPQVSVDNVAPDTVVGVTVWRLRAATQADSGERLVVHDDSASS